MAKHRKMSDWEDLLIGKTFNWLTVLSIEQCYMNNKKHGYFAVCKCTCGATTKVAPNKLLSGCIYSCGCYKLSKEFIMSQHKWQSDSDKLRAASEKNRQFYIDHPEKIKEISEKNKEYWSSHHDIVLDRANKHREYYINNPESRKKLSEKRIKYFKDNPDAIKKLSETQIKYFSEHPDECKQRAIKYLKWYNDNPDKVLEMQRKQHLWLQDKDKLVSAVEKRKQTFKENPQIQEAATEKFKQWAANNRAKLLQIGKNRSDTFSNKRSKMDYSDLLAIIHQDYIDSLLNGEIKSTDLIKTKCPLCGEFDDHRLHNLFVFNSCTFKYGHPLLCSKCATSLNSSFYEQEIADFISTIFNGELIRNSREIISPLELDLYYPEKKIAIEFNGDYWHSSEFKDSKYHYNKFLQCKNLGITLVSVFEHHWKLADIKIKQYLFDLFNDTENALSLKDNLYMNNNYPFPKISIDNSNIVEDSYEYKNFKVYTCGYSKIIKGDKNG